MKTKILLGLIAFTLIMQSCRENYSNGERIGLITQFSQKGRWWKSWEGHLNLTQTGTNSATNGFDFSIDNDNEDSQLIKTIDSATIYGWKVKLIYHQVSGWNWFGNRGHTNYFVTKCEILDKELSGNLNISKQILNSTSNLSGLKNKDTLYIINITK